MPWPAITDFTDAIQNPRVCFADPQLADLAAGQVVRHPRRGTPLVYSGNFAAAYPVVCGSRKYAVRCFTREVKDQRVRYGHLTNYLSQTLPAPLVEFDFYERGIKLLGGDWYAIVKMEWVNGEPLDKYVKDRLGQPVELNRVARRWRGAVGDILQREIAHNDLQHGNVMVQFDSSIRLVDYDGIFLPQYQGQDSPEVGHRNFQHPLRTGKDYAKYVDNFPALVIYLSLLALAADPSLWRFNNDDNLILTRADFLDPSNSECFRGLKASQDAAVRHLAGSLEECCSMPVNEVPDLEEVLSGAPSSNAPASPSQTGAAPAPAAPSNTGATTRVIGGGSEYLRLLQMRQAGQSAPGITPPQPATPAPPPQAAPVAQPQPAAPPISPAAAAATMVCPGCNRTNPAELIYCDDEACAVVMYPGTRYCAYCGLSIPTNGNFCPECGLQMS